ncbi:MAG: NYN domain-containing protein [Gemmatimonadota bacterium]
MNEVFARAPHLRSPAVEQSQHAALMIDFDNVTMGIRSNLGQEIRKLLDSDVIRGKVSVQRAYADWRRYPQYIVPLSEASVDLIFAPAYGSSKKNATDIRLAIDALEIVFTRPEIGTFILLSGDSDFSSLVLKLKEYGKYVIGVGMQESSSDLLVQNCDEYYSYNSLSGLTAASEATTETFDPWVLAARTIQRMMERKDVMRSDRFKQVMLEFDPSFSERSLGFSKFNRFLSEAASRGIITLEKAANGQYEVAKGSRADDLAKRSHSTGEPSPPRTPARSPASRARGGNRNRRGGSRRSSSQETREAPPSDQPAPEVDEDRLRGAYTLLKSVVGDLAAANDAVRDSEVKRQMLKREPRFDEAALGFRKFSRFLRQAHDEGVVNLEQGAEGNYLLSPLASPPSESATKAIADSRAPESAERPSRGRKRGGRGRERPDRPAATIDAPAVPAEAPVAEPEITAPEITASETTEAERSEPAAPARRGLGRFRRGSRGRVSPPATAARQQKSSEPAAAPSAAETPSAADAPKPAPSAKSTRPSSKSARPPSKHKREIERMSRAYPGVGRRTAERLYEEFGDGLLSVIDDHPERIKSVLPEHRAQAVIDGRKAEREAAGAD